MNHIFLFLFTMFPCMVMAQGWQWGRVAGSPSEMIESYSVATDATGNVYGAGVSADSGTIDFGSGVVLTLPPASSSIDYHFFVVKYNSAGIAQWARSATGMNWINAMAVDPSGNLILFGSFHSTQMQIGAITLNNFVGGANPYFIARLNSAGTVLWAVSDGDVGGGYDLLFGDIRFSDGGVATDDTGNIYITTSFTKPNISINAAAVINTDPTGATADVLVAKYNAAGVFQWVRAFGGSGNDFGYGIAAAPSGAVYVTGAYRSSSFMLGASTLSNPSSGSVPYAYLARLSPAGVPMWGQGAGGPNGAAGIGVGVDQCGGAYICGEFADTAIKLGTATFARPFTSASPRLASFLARYSAADTLCWARTMGSVAHGVHTYGLAVAPCGQVWMMACDTDDVQVNGHLYPAAAGPDPTFIAGFDPDGGSIGYSSLPSAGDDQSGIAIDASGNLAACGDLAGLTTVVVGPDTLVNYSGSERFLLGRYTSVHDTFSYATDTSVCGLAGLTLSGIPGCAIYTWSDHSTLPALTVYSSGTYYVQNLLCDALVVDTFHVTMQAAPCNSGIRDPAGAGNIYLYPNPAGNEIRIVASARISSIDILNPVGQLLIERQFDADHVCIDVSGLVPGVYFVRINKGQTLRFVRE